MARSEANLFSAIAGCQPIAVDNVYYVKINQNESALFGCQLMRSIPLQRPSCIGTTNQENDTVIRFRSHAHNELSSYQHE